MSNPAPPPAASSTSAIPGGDTCGRRYTNAGEMWNVELKGDLYDEKDGWYGKSLAYWKKQEPTVSGVLGGMEHIHGADIAESKAFIESIPTIGRTRALDCGAGIGRITKNLLAPLFAKTDLLEPMHHMLVVAQQELDMERVGHLIEASMEQVTLTEKYDIIVIQWTAIYLTDEHFVDFFSKCKSALSPGGIIFFKENTSSVNKFMVDKDDSSLTRSDQHYKALFETSGLTLIKEDFQRTWPKDLLPVKMYALQ
ncbi:methyltransferase, putative [Bodo saltans]|uniref:Alpha N-terminal protein methyltransferase 1 n=1 Tax=Bodo saltans TaxID=75058 RepID=A0A0S4J7U1_BODSA|nr:methyltransferase, putative [Bodo saltans]|eukprot:CUG87479.1 methyltransferase, putative [Bodo saltans]